MTKDEIKKALLYCQNYDWDNCDDCPYTKSKKSGLCKELMHTDALKLINEQEKEIERLKEEKKQTKIDVLNKLKEKLGNYEDHCSEMHDWQGQTAICECEKYVDELIKEI